MQLFQQKHNQKRWTQPKVLASQEWYLSSHGWSADRGYNGILTFKDNPDLSYNAMFTLEELKDLQAKLTTTIESLETLKKRRECPLYQSHHYNVVCEQCGLKGY